MSGVTSYEQHVSFQWKASSCLSVWEMYVQEVSIVQGKTKRSLNCTYTKYPSTSEGGIKPDFIGRGPLLQYDNKLLNFTLLRSLVIGFFKLSNYCNPPTLPTTSLKVWPGALFPVKRLCVAWHGKDLLPRRIFEWLSWASGTVKEDSSFSPLILFGGAVCWSLSGLDLRVLCYTAARITNKR